MKRTHIAGIIVGLLFFYGGGVVQSRAADFPWPTVLPAIFAGAKFHLPPGTLVFPTSGEVLVRYDRDNSSDWIEFVGTPEADKPGLPITRIRGNIDDSPFTFYISNNTITRLDIDQRQLLFSYDAENNISFTLSRIAATKQKLSDSAKGEGVDCSRTKDSYQAEKEEAADVIILAIAAFYTACCYDPWDPSEEDPGQILARVIHYLRGSSEFRGRVAQYEAAEQALQNYDSLCSSKKYFLFKRSGTGYRGDYGGWSDKVTGYDYFYQYILPADAETVRANFARFKDFTAGACQNLPATCPCPPYPDIWANGTVEIVGAFNTLEELAPYRCEWGHYGPSYLICNMWIAEGLPYPGFWDTINSLCGK